MRRISILTFAVSTLIMTLWSCGGDVGTTTGNTSNTSLEEEDIAAPIDENSIFKKMSDKLKEMEKEEGLSDLMKTQKNEDGSNVFDDALKEIAVEDQESDGMVSDMMEKIFRVAEKELGIDIEEKMMENMENTNTYSKKGMEVLKDLGQKAEEGGYTEHIEGAMEGLQDFLDTGGKNGGLEQLLEEAVKLIKKEDPSSSDLDWMKEIEKVLDNDIKDPAKEVERIFIENMQKQGLLMPDGKTINEEAIKRMAREQRAKQNQ